MRDRRGLLLLHVSGLRVGLSGIVITCFHRYAHGLEKLSPGHVNRPGSEGVTGTGQDTVVLNLSR